jgi:hypothetical protein
MKTFAIVNICLILLPWVGGLAGAETIYGKARVVDRGKVVVNGKSRNFGDFKLQLVREAADAGTSRVIRRNGDTVVVVDRPEAAAPAGPVPKAPATAIPPGRGGAQRRMRLSDFKALQIGDRALAPDTIRINRTKADTQHEDDPGH